MTKLNHKRKDLGRPPKRHYNLYISDETKNDSKYIIKGNDLTCRWIGNSILIWSRKDIDDILKKLLESLK